MGTALPRTAVQPASPRMTVILALCSWALSGRRTAAQRLPETQTQECYYLCSRILSDCKAAAQGSRKRERVTKARTPSAMRCGREHTIPCNADGRLSSTILFCWLNMQVSTSGSKTDHRVLDTFSLQYNEIHLQPTRTSKQVRRRSALYRFWVTLTLTSQGLAKGVEPLLLGAC